MMDDNYTGGDGGILEKRANEGFAPGVLVRGTVSAGPGGGLEVPADVPSPYVELGALFGAWNTRRRWEMFDDSDNRRIVGCARVTDIVDQRWNSRRPRV